MESFPEEDKQVILSEIQRLREAIDDGRGRSTESLFCSSEESDLEECEDDSYDFTSYEEVVEEQDDIPSQKNRAPWLAVEQSDNDSSSDESGYPSDIVRKTQAFVEQSAFQNYSATNMETEAAFVKKQSVLVDVGNADVSAKPKDQGISNTTADHADSGSSLLAPDTSSMDIGSLEWALQLNRDYQDIVTEELMRIDDALRNNKSMQAEIESQSSRSKNPNLIGHTFFGRFRPTYLKDSFGQGPPENEDSKKINALKEVHPFISSQKAWKEKERHLLAEGVRNQNLERITLQLKQELNELKNKGEDDNNSNLQREIKSIEKRLEDLKKDPPEEFEKPLEGLDFLSISRVYLPERTEKECRVRWLNLEHPAINHSKWTKEENSRLKELSEKYNKRHWERIARELGTQRTPVQCFQHFQKSINKAHANSPWTKEEDEQLLNAVKVCTKGNWLQVSAMVEGKTPAQCLNRYDKCLKPGLKKGQWSKEENKILLKYVEIYGPGQWKKISEHIPGRSDTAVRERWVNNYDRSLKLRRKWSKKEDISLLQAVDKYGASNWTKVAKYLPGRTDNMCWRRWKTIKKEESLDCRKEKLMMNTQTPLQTGGRYQNLPSDEYHTGCEKWKPRIYRKKLDEDTEREEPLQGHIEGSIDNSAAVYTDNNYARVSGEKINYKDDEETSIDGDEADQNRADDDPDYQPEVESLLENEIAEEVCCKDPKNQAIFEEGERVVGRYDAGIVSYIDAKRSLCKLKSRIKGVKSRDDKKKLVRVNARHMEELDNIHIVRKDKDNVPTGRKKQSTIRIDVSESVHGVENMGARSLRPVNIGHLPEDLAPFTVLLEVFRIDYETIMQKLQARASLMAPSSSKALKVAASPPRVVSSTISSTTISVSPASSCTASSTLQSSSTATTRGATSSSSAMSGVSSSNTSGKAAGSGTSSSVVESRTGAPSVESESSGNDKSNRMQKRTLNSQSHTMETTSTKAMSSKAVAKVTPIAPNLVTMRAFRKLLLHREKLSTMSKSSPLYQTDSVYHIDENQREAATDSMSNSGAISNRNVLSKSHCAPFANMSDYKTLSARFNALFMWPLLLLTHEARRIDRNGPTKEIVGGQNEQSCTGTLLKTVAQRHRTENSMNERQELISHGIVRRDLSAVAKEIECESRGKGQELISQKVPEKRARSGRKRKKRSIETQNDSDLDDSFCSDLTDMGISAGRLKTRSVTSVVPNAVSRSKQSRRKRSKVASR